MKKVMKLLDERTGLMECIVCSARHIANKKSKDKFHYGSWQCKNGCKFE